MSDNTTSVPVFIFTCIFTSHNIISSPQKPAVKLYFKIMHVYIFIFGKTPIYKPRDYVYTSLGDGQSMIEVLSLRFHVDFITVRKQS